MSMSWLRPRALVGLATASLLGLAGCDGSPTSPVAGPDRLAAPLDALEGVGTGLPIDHRIVNTTLAWGTVAFEGVPCADDLRLVRVGHPFSGDLADMIAGSYPFPAGTPSFADLLLPFGMLPNVEFLTEDLTIYGNAAYVLQAAVAAHVAGLEAALGAGLHVETTIQYVESRSYSLYGGIIRPDGSWILPDDPDYDDPPPGSVVLTGTATVGFYAVHSTVTALTPVSCATARSHKESARDRLVPHAGHPDRDVRKRVEKALERLDESLEPRLWVDEDHLDPKHGKKVFDEEKKAAHELMKLLDDDDLDAALIADLEAALAAMLAADRALAATAIGEVECHGNAKCENELENAERRMERAEAYADEGRVDKAIGEFRKAWEKAAGG